MNEFYEKVIQGLKEAVAIEKGELSVEEIRNLPAPTYRSIEDNEADPEVYFVERALQTAKMTLKDILLGNSNDKENQMTN